MDTFLGFKINKYPYKEKIEDTEHIYAHTKEGKPNELLEEHMELCIKYLKDIETEKKLRNTFDRFYAVFFGEYQENDLCKKMFFELIYNAVYTHDLGKTNKNFQSLKMANEYFEQFSKDINCNKESGHSMLSAIMYLDYYVKYILSIEELEIPVPSPIFRIPSPDT